jgi:hypothetical protein
VPRKKPAPRVTSESGFTSPNWLTAAYKFGAPTAMIAYLIYWMTSVATPLLMQIADSTKEVAAQSIENGAKINRICLNTSKTDPDRIACVVVK